MKSYKQALSPEEINFPEHAIIPTEESCSLFHGYIDEQRVVLNLGDLDTEDDIAWIKWADNASQEILDADKRWYTLLDVSLNVPRTPFYYL